VSGKNAKILSKISILLVACTNVKDDRQTTDLRLMPSQAERNVVTLG